MPLKKVIIFNEINKIFVSTKENINEIIIN